MSFKFDKDSRANLISSSLRDSEPREKLTTFELT
jgi:hypothetical protein